MLFLVLLIFAAFFLFSFIHYAAGSKRPFKRAALSIFCGLFALTAVNLLGSVTGVTIPVTNLSVLTSAVGGVPGVALLVMLNLM